jgi:haloalkane dehalogenase
MQPDIEEKQYAPTADTAAYPSTCSMDSGEHPFACNWFQRQGTLIHYVDHGYGRPILFLHGFHEGSYQFRNVIKGLDGFCRSIAPDYPGSGRSFHAKRAVPPTPKDHVDWIHALIDHLNLESFLLVCQGWGGPIGLSLVSEYPEKVEGLVLCNTQCWHPMKGLSPKKRRKGQNLHGRFSRMILSVQETLRAKASPFQGESPLSDEPIFGNPLKFFNINRQALYRHTLHAWLRSVQSQLDKLKDTPVELVWGMKDPIYGHEAIIRKWLGYFPQASVDRVMSAASPVHEHAPDRVIAAVRRLIHPFL